MKILSTSAVVLVAAVLSGCMNTKAIVVGERSFAARPTDHPIDIYLPVDAPVGVHEAASAGGSKAREPGEVPEDAVVIGRVDASAGPLDGWGRVLDDARSKARTMGGDALVMHHWENHGGMSMLMCIPVGGGGKQLSMRVVRYAGE